MTETNDDNIKSTAAAATSAAPPATTVDDSANSYHESSLTSCPPLFQLQIYGLCCPFLISEEEHDARIGVINLHNYPIVWYRKKLVKDVLATHDFNDVLKTTANVVDGMISQLFGGSGGGGGASDRGSEGLVGGASIPMSYIGIPSTMTIVDTDTHGPVIQIRTLDGCWDEHTNQDDPKNINNTAASKETTTTTPTKSTATAAAAVREYMTNGTPWWNDESLCNKPPAKVIPLYMVDKVTSSGWNFRADGGKGGVRLYASPASTASSSEMGVGALGGFINSGGFGHELLRFDTLGGGGETFNDSLSTRPEEPNKYADKVIVQLKSLIDWNRRRMASDIQSGRVSVAPKGVGNKGSGFIASKP